MNGKKLHRAGTLLTWLLSTAGVISGSDFSVGLLTGYNNGWAFNSAAAPPGSPRVFPLRPGSAWGTRPSSLETRRWRARSSLTTPPSARLRRKAALGIQDHGRGGVQLREVTAQGGLISNSLCA
jgi:hypothetical protein